MGGIETVVLPSGAAPHTTSFSPDGAYAYVSNIGDGDRAAGAANCAVIVSANGRSGQAGMESRSRGFRPETARLRANREALIRP